MSGFVYLVGAGPGDPELLTLRAVSALQQADAIVYDRLVHPGALAHAAPHTRLLYVGKEGGGAQVPQQEINELLIAQARLGRVVVRLKGGDPFVFGRGGEEALALEAAGVPYAVVPGVSSGVAAPALAGIPVTHRGVAAAVTFATCTLADGEADWAYLAGAPTLVLFMAGAKLAAVCRGLVTAGRASHTPAAIVESASLPSQRVTVSTLAELPAVAAATGVGSPALLVIGDVVSLRAQLAGLCDNPLPAEAAASVMVP
ncbi:MAG: uroporphyrinogen-III C-methyltransferase [Kofleriaceae bacterium]